MDYGTFRPETGYNAPAAPAVKSTALEPAETAGLINEKEKFKELVVTDGVGQYHINHYISYGAGSASEVSKIHDLFFREFVDVFEANTAARASWGEHEVNGHPTVEFKVGGKDEDFLELLGGFFHSDWVFMRKAGDGGSFYGSTLRRQFLLDSEVGALMASAFPFASPATRLALFAFIRVNQHHFLAGRRSWRLGYDPQLKRPYVETAAFERSSLYEYTLLEGTGFFRKTINEIWTSLLANARKHFTTINWISPGSLPDQSVRAGYETADDVDYRAGSFDTPEEAFNQPWFKKILPRHPGLLEGL